MCGIAGIVGDNWVGAQLYAMVGIQHHRGPDASGTFISSDNTVGLGHNRLSIIDLSDAGRQPMFDVTGRYWIVFNGEIYNYLELRQELSHVHQFRTRTDTEVLLEAYKAWGQRCLDRFVGMFAFAIWDERERSLFVARDRFGVKPTYYSLRPDGTLFLASEIKALHAAGVAASPDAVTWSTYLTYGVCDHSDRTFWENVHALPGGCTLKWQDGRIRIATWYDLSERVGALFDERSEETVEAEYLALLFESVRLRFRSDVPVGINLSGGLDSSTLLGLVQSVQGSQSDVKAFTFVTGDPNYDELPWVNQMLASTKHPSVSCRLEPEDVPDLCESVLAHQDEPFGGLPTLAYARLFERARAEGVVVLLDGQGMDEQWAGYDYYRSALNGPSAAIVQGIIDRPVRPECLTVEFRALAQAFRPERPFTDQLCNLQYRDIKHTKIPRALRFNDRVSMRSSTELREPFLDHRLVELALRQPTDRKRRDDISKWLLRRIAEKLLPNGVVKAPKRPVQTPQREWLRGPLRKWTEECLDRALMAHGGSWLDTRIVRKQWHSYLAGESDNSFYVWQWISLIPGISTKGCQRVVA